MLSFTREFKDEDSFGHGSRASILLVYVERETIELLDRGQEILNDRVFVAKVDGLEIATRAVDNVLAHDATKQTVEMIVRRRREVGLRALTERRPEFFDVYVNAPLGITGRANAGRQELSSNDIFERHR